MADMNMYKYPVIPTNKPVDLCTNLIPRKHSNKLDGLLIFLFFYDTGDSEISLYISAHTYMYMRFKKKMAANVCINGLLKPLGDPVPCGLLSDKSVISTSLGKCQKWIKNC